MDSQPACLDMAAEALASGWGRAGGDGAVELFGPAGADGVSIRRSPSGRVNETYFVGRDGVDTHVLQKLNPLLAAHAGNMCENMSLACRALAGSGVGRPEIVPAGDGGWFHYEPGDRSFWRLTSFLPGEPPDKGDRAQAALCAGALGRCHAGLNRPRPLDLLPTYEPGPHAGDVTNQKLCRAGDFDLVARRYRGHPRLPEVAGDVARGRQAADWLPARPEFQMVFLGRGLVVHLDCKRDNFLLTPEGQAVIDWDTLGYGDPLLDLGEMCRSWAVRESAPRYDAGMVSALLEGYRRTGMIPDEQYSLLPAVVRGLALNLARRYLTDALAEVYFKFDAEHYPSLFEQNRLRGGRLLDLVEELMDREIELSRL
ncbi:MAG: aminoglycoside phosphotransferase family protein [Deltaproteobacteria bacterium]|nr:aminoglycoside phosphotransferase family protein [Deltaproteobacteria bacterium]